ncbi:flagellar assembly protein A [Saliterribacillus persicus]|uniref:RNA-binding protein KhpB N-terminal domain-containing protein n=1 Tax=Saliterribacillus persicus TaxID=930114 RepID=A0A368XZB7_9BACI|nr:flagellar assembly protein A [Saliterribacillus persicus]RCW71887.1 hypothetical protein DFR57_10570 [Saliterribacillus persicus]
MRELISKGKTVHEAIAIGLELMEVKKKEVNIEILQHATSGFIGLGKKEAVVKLSKAHKKGKAEVEVANNTNDLNDNIDEDISLDKLMDEYLEKEEVTNENITNENLSNTKIKVKNNHGYAWIKDNHLEVKDMDDIYATASIGKGITLYRNEQKVTDSKIILTENDKYRLDYEKSSKKAMSWSISVIKNGLEAMLDVKPGEITEWQLKEVDEAEHIDIELISESKPINTLTEDQILKRLEELNVTVGINQDAIDHAIGTKEAGRFVVATGLEPKEGMNGELELKVDINASNGLMEDEQGNVNFKDSKMIPSVEIGTILAILHPPIPGLSGKTVTSEEIPAKDTYALQLNKGSGVDLIDDKLIATEPGKPVIEKRGHYVKASILSKLVHDGNVNLASGNIRFNGDIEIRGEVEDNMIVEAGGDIYIHQNVSESSLTASKSMIIKGNVGNSNLAAGKHNLLVMELGQVIQVLSLQVKQMIPIIEQLMKSPVYKKKELTTNGLQPMIMLLLEKKFKDFKTSAKKYVDIVERADRFIEEEEWKNVSRDIKRIFINLSSQKTNLNDLKTLLESMEELTVLSHAEVEPNSFITISDTVNSQIYSSGDIQIIGKGCINSKVHAGGKLDIHGIARGGELFGRLGISINEVGSISGTKTTLSVPKDQKIKLSLAYEGTLLRIGETIYRVQRDERFITAQLNDKEQIIIH